jgi:hypothetical protein
MSQHRPPVPAADSASEAIQRASGDHQKTTRKPSKGTLPSTERRAERKAEAAAREAKQRDLFGNS